MPRRPQSLLWIEQLPQRPDTDVDAERNRLLEAVDWLFEHKCLDGKGVSDGSSTYWQWLSELRGAEDRADLVASVHRHAGADPATGRPGLAAAWNRSEIPDVVIQLLAEAVPERTHARVDKLSAEAPWELLPPEVTAYLEDAIEQWGGGLGDEYPDLMRATAYYTLLTTRWTVGCAAANRPADLVTYAAAVETWDGTNRPAERRADPYQKGERKAVLWQLAERLPEPFRAVETTSYGAARHDFARFWRAGHGRGWTDLLDDVDSLHLLGRALAHAEVDAHASAICARLRIRSPERHVQKQQLEEFVTSLRNDVGQRLRADSAWLQAFRPLELRTNVRFSLPSVKEMIADTFDLAAQHWFFLRVASQHPEVTTSPHFEQAYHRLNRNANELESRLVWLDADPALLHRQPDAYKVHLYGLARAFCRSDLRDAHVMYELRGARALRERVEPSVLEWRDTVNRGVERAIDVRTAMLWSECKRILQPLGDPTAMRKLAAYAQGLKKPAPCDNPRWATGFDVPRPGYEPIRGGKSEGHIRAARDLALKSAGALPGPLGRTVEWVVPGTRRSHREALPAAVRRALPPASAR